MDFTSWYGDMQEQKQPVANPADMDPNSPEYQEWLKTHNQQAMSAGGGGDEKITGLQKEKSGLGALIASFI